MTGPDPKLWWYVARAAGIVAWAMLAVSVVWGLMLSTRLFGRRPAPAWLTDFHRFVGGLAVVFTGIHVAGIAADSYVHFGPAEIFVPFASRWRPASVTWGVVGFYLLVAIELTSYAMRRLPNRVWRAVHRSSSALFLVVTVHGATAGTDVGGAPVAQWIALIAVASAVFLYLLRVVSPRGAAIRARREAARRAPG